MDRDAGGGNRFDARLGGRRPLLEQRTRVRIDGCGILPVSLVQLEHVPTVQAGEFLPTGHIPIIVSAFARIEQSPGSLTPMTFLLLLALTLHLPAHFDVQAPRAQDRLREDTVHSVALGRAMKYRVLVPEDYERSQRRYPVLYLLHGLGGNYTDWTSRSNVAEYSRVLP